MRHDTPSFDGFCKNDETLSFDGCSRKDETLSFDGCSTRHETTSLEGGICQLFVIRVIVSLSFRDAVVITAF